MKMLRTNQPALDPDHICFKSGLCLENAVVRSTLAIFRCNMKQYLFDNKGTKVHPANICCGPCLICEHSVSHVYNCFWIYFNILLFFNRYQPTTVQNSFDKKNFNKIYHKTNYVLGSGTFLMGNVKPLIF